MQNIYILQVAEPASLLPPSLKQSNVHLLLPTYLQNNPANNLAAKKPSSAAKQFS